MARDEFSSSVKRALAERAGYRCSFPGCDAETIGPSDESEDATSNTGTAAHISAASSGKGSRRYDASLTPEQRSSIENGLWCCRHHGTLIDTDEVTYSTQMLKKWREIAERKAQIRQRHPGVRLSRHPELVNIGIAVECLKLAADNRINQIIGQAIVHCYIEDVWGKSFADSIRDFLIEYAKNAFEHAGAKSITIKLQSREIVIEDDGKHFDPNTLIEHSHGRGGRAAYRALRNTLRLPTISSTNQSGTGNLVYLPLVANAWELETTNPCTVNIDIHNLRSSRFSFKSYDSCDCIYIVAPEYISYSDWTPLGGIVYSAQQTGKRIVVIVSKASAGVIEFGREQLPGVEIVEWGRE
ncbi:putative lipoprotein [Burkholderia aenigmatica]|uniref:Putative lipoprotein n=1 Tax=Burkholderia aenigmatica TaxID=2015348 RepID=A0A6P2RN89_9BURK|nr:MULTISPECIES: hypothetical protein [Burkholderia]VWC37051.1 putative lipoprotein [Burkholderia aenigmatica]